MTTTTSDRPEPMLAEAPRRLRVLHLLPDLAIGGGQSIVLQHARRFDPDRFDVRVAHLGGDRSLASAFAECGTEPVDLGDTGVATTVVRIVRLLREVRPDVLHVHSGRDRKLGQVAALLTRTAVVGHLHSEWVHLGARWPDGAGPFRRARGRLVGWVRDEIERRTVRGYVAESRAVAALFRPLVTQPIGVLDQAIPVERFDDACASGDARAVLRQELDVPATATVLVTVARMVDGKGHLALLEALAGIRSRHPDVVLVVVGDGPLRPAVEAAIAGHGLAAAVSLLGDRHDVPRVLAAADCFVFASETEGFGIAVLEAMAARLPVVAFRLPALEEFVVDGHTGRLVPLGDVPALAAAVVDVLEDRRRARQLGDAARHIVETRFPPDAVARSLVAVHTAAAHRTRGGARRGEVAR